MSSVSLISFNWSRHILEKIGHAYGMNKVGHITVNLSNLKFEYDNAEKILRGHCDNKVLK